MYVFMRAYTCTNIGICICMYVEGALIGDREVDSLGLAYIIDIYI
jgi:hypothetical protein